MKYLIDTHIFLWFIQDSPSLPTNIKSLMEDGNNQLLLSMASIWEIAIKYSLGKLQLNGAFEEFIEEQLSLNEIALLPIQIKHLKKLINLPFHHKDPFDRLIIAQAITEKETVISVDQYFRQYPVSTIYQ
jgi:PIN domain nuclease of toxin-antitoxin system